MGEPFTTLIGTSFKVAIASGVEFNRITNCFVPNFTASASEPENLEREFRTNFCGSCRVSGW
jgi:hypothetical protein